MQNGVDTRDLDHFDHFFLVFVQCEVYAAADDKNDFDGYGEKCDVKSVAVKGLTGLTQAIQHFVVPGHLVVDFLGFGQEVSDLVYLCVSLHILMDVVGGLAAYFVEDWQLGEVQKLFFAVMSHLNVLNKLCTEFLCGCCLKWFVLCFLGILFIRIGVCHLFE